MIGEARLNSMMNKTKLDTADNTGSDIPTETIKLLDKLTPIKIGNPITATSPEKHSVSTNRLPLGVLKILPALGENQKDDMHLFRLYVQKNKTWKIDVTDLNHGKTINYCSGSNGLKRSMDGRVYTGSELYAMQRSNMHGRLSQ